MKLYVSRQLLLILAAGPVGVMPAGHVAAELLRLVASETGLVIKLARSPGFCAICTPDKERCVDTSTENGKPVCTGAMLPTHQPSRSFPRTPLALLLGK